MGGAKSAPLPQPAYQSNIDMSSGLPQLKGGDVGQVRTFDGSNPAQVSQSNTAGKGGAGMPNSQFEQAGKGGSAMPAVSNAAQQAGQFGIKSNVAPDSSKGGQAMPQAIAQGLQQQQQIQRNLDAGKGGQQPPPR